MCKNCKILENKVEDYFNSQELRDLSKVQFFHHFGGQTEIVVQWFLLGLLSDCVMRSLMWSLAAVFLSHSNSIWLSFVKALELFWVKTNHRGKKNRILNAQISLSNYLLIHVLIRKIVNIKGTSGLKRVLHNWNISKFHLSLNLSSNSCLKCQNRKFKEYFRFEWDTSGFNYISKLQNKYESVFKYIFKNSESEFYFGISWPPDFCKSIFYLGI